MLQGDGREVLRLDLEREKLDRQTLAGLTAAHDQTVATIGRRPDVIYQAAFFDGRWVGYTDFLLRTNRPTRLALLELRGFVELNVTGVSQRLADEIRGRQRDLDKERVVHVGMHGQSRDDPERLCLECGSLWGRRAAPH